MLFRFYTSSLLFVFWNTCEGVLQVPSVFGYGDETTTVICTDPTITPGNNYFWLRNSFAIYSKSNEGTVKDGKYNGTTQTGQLSLQVLNTNITDAGQYQCNHNFIDAYGTVYVAYKPKRVIYTVSRGNVLQLNLTAFTVYPNSSTINSVICNGKTTETFNASQTIVSNNEDTLLFDINWIGTTANVSLTGDYVCTVNLTLIEPYITTLNVSFTAAEKTEEPKPCWCQWWCIFLIILAVVVAVICLSLVIHKKCTAGSEIDFNRDKDSTQIKSVCKIKVTTGNERNHGTMASIWIKMMSPNRKQIGHKSGVSNEQWSDTIHLVDEEEPWIEPRSVKTFTNITLDVEDIRKIELGHDGTREGDDFYVKKVEIDFPSKKKRFDFTMDRWIFHNKGNEVNTNNICIADVPDPTSQPNRECQYVIKISTANRVYNADMWINMISPHGEQTGCHELVYEEGQLSESGSVKTIESVFIEQIQEIELGNEGARIEDNVYVKKVEIKIPLMEKQFDFTTDCWILHNNRIGVKRSKIFTLDASGRPVLPKKGINNKDKKVDPAVQNGNNLLSFDDSPELQQHM